MKLVERFWNLVLRFVADVKGAIRYTALSGLISVLVMTFTWELLAQGLLPSATFFDKLLVAVGAFFASFVVTRLLLGKQREGPIA